MTFHYILLTCLLLPLPTVAADRPATATGGRAGASLPPGYYRVDTTATGRTAAGPIGMRSVLETSGATSDATLTGTTTVDRQPSSVRARGDQTNHVCVAPGRAPDSAAVCQVARSAASPTAACRLADARALQIRQLDDRTWEIRHDAAAPLVAADGGGSGVARLRAQAAADIEREVASLPPAQAAQMQRQAAALRQPTGAATHEQPLTQVVQRYIRIAEKCPKS